MFIATSQSVLVDAPIESKIRNSKQVNPALKQDFINLLSYFTPDELRELETLL